MNETQKEDSLSSSSEYYDSIVEICEQGLVVEETVENEEKFMKTGNQLPFCSSSSESLDSDAKLSVQREINVEEMEKHAKETKNIQYQFSCQPSSSKSHNSETLCNQGLTTEETTKDEQQVKKTKKRTAQPETWSKAIAKRARNSGQCYVSCSKSKRVINARSLKPPCEPNKCKFRCSTKIDDQKRLELFQSYWDLNDLIRQRDFISKCIKKVEGERRIKCFGPFRDVNRAYYFNDGDRRIRVCKKMFMATLDISQRAIRTVIAKQEDGYLGQDLRGKHKKRLSSEIVAGIKQHIDSHYLLQETSREYINGNKSLADLYRHYKNSCKEKGIASASRTMYSRIFNCEYDISVHSQQKDKSDLCEQDNNSSSSQ